MIELTQEAQQQIRHILQEAQDSGLRVFVEGGGCSGLNYGFALESSPEESDWVLEQDGFQVWVDPVSMQYLESSVIDYKSGLMQSGFVISNPNAKSTCGCGSSFAAG
jgi:iron-sulfur cluster assembly accessory protein